LDYNLGSLKRVFGTAQRFGFASARLARKPKGVLAINILAAFAP
jgi:hypothetical protein